MRHVPCFEGCGVCELQRRQRERRMSIAFAPPLRVDQADVLDSYAIGHLVRGLYGEIEADIERTQPRARRVLPWA